MSAHFMVLLKPHHPDVATLIEDNIKITTVVNITYLRPVQNGQPNTSTAQCEADGNNGSQDRRTDIPYFIVG